MGQRGLCACPGDLRTCVPSLCISLCKRNFIGRAVTYVGEWKGGCEAQRERGGLEHWDIGEDRGGFGRKLYDRG